MPGDLLDERAAEDVHHAAGNGDHTARWLGFTAPAFPGSGWVAAALASC